jgi:hypothetical protein
MDRPWKLSKGRYRGGLREATTGLLPTQVLRLLPTEGKTRWTSLLLALCAILMAWSGGSTLADRFDSARCCLVRWYPGRRRPGSGYEGFIAALRRRSGWLVRQICRHYRTQVRELAEARGCWSVEGWLAFGVDSTKHDVPMTVANEARLGCASRARSWPQMMLTTVFHLGSGLPWSFVRGRARSSERRHLMGLLCTLPPAALLLADAGFTGYAFWRKLTGSGGGFLVRVGSNVRLLQGLGVQACIKGDGIVWVWPADQQKKRQPPLVLRLITLTDERNRTMYLLTSVLDEAQLSGAAAGRLYALRWGVELMYRSLKQVMGRRKLLSDSPRHARVELSWAMIGLWTLMLIKAQRCPTLKANQGVAEVLRVLRRTMQGGRPDAIASLRNLKPDASKRTRPKKARHWPHRKRPKLPGRPNARNATDAELSLAKELAEISNAA